MAATAVGIGISSCFKDSSGELTVTGARCIAAGIITDTVAVLTLIAVGIIGALGLLSLPPAASYTMIGLGAAIALPHILWFIMMGLDMNSDSPFDTHTALLSSFLPQKQRTH